MRGLYSYREGRPNQSDGPQSIIQPFFQIQHAPEGVEGAIGKPPPHFHKDKATLFICFHTAVQPKKQGRPSHPNGPQAISQPFFQVQHAPEGVEGAIGKPPPHFHKDKATLFICFHTAVQPKKQGRPIHSGGPQVISQPFFQVQHAAEGVEGAIGKPPPLHRKGKTTLTYRNPRRGTTTK